jgi:uncharacterized protein
LPGTRLLFGLLIGALAYYANQIEPGQVEVNHVHIPLPELGPAFDGYRIAQISDIHIDTWMTPERLQASVELVNRQEPDLIAITGDFVTTRLGDYAGALRAALRELRAPDGVIAVPGNHDHYRRGEIDILRRLLADCGITDLSNTFCTIWRGDDALHLAGVDDVSMRKARLDRVLAELPPAGPAVLLCHAPDFADVSAAVGRFGLQISGHTHGGQVRLPLIGALKGPHYGTLYDAGLTMVGGMRLYVNRGLGMTLPVRLNCRPEITVFELRPPDYLQG